MTKIVLKDTRKTEVVELPSFPGSRVELYDGLLFGQIKQIEKAQSNFDRGVMTLIFLIKDWNFTDENGKKLPVEERVLNSFPAQDLTFLLRKATKILEEAQKKTKKS